MGIYIIVFIGIILRLLFINKADGLWNDEYVSWMIASTPFTQGFWEGVKSQCHMPFYYLYLKFFMSIFGQSDLLLRLTSVITGVLSIPVMYFVGLEKDKKVGFFAAFLTAISSFLIYYSQEVRIYSVLFLFSALSLLFTLRLIKNTNTKNLILYALSNFFIIFTHTIGFVYVFFNMIFVSSFLFKSHKRFILKLWSILTILGLVCMPVIVNIFTTKSISQWWGVFTFSRWGFLITDYFSPVLTNLVNSPNNFFFNFKSGFIIFAFIPLIIACIWIIRALFNKKQAGLFSICLGVIIVMTIAAILGKLVFITKYSIEIYPILIFLAAIGALSFSNKLIRNSLIVLYCLIHLTFLTTSPLAAYKLPRNQGHKIATDLIKSMNPAKGDIILLQYYQKVRFEKYFDFTDYENLSIAKGNFAEYLSEGVDYQMAQTQGKELYKDIFSKSHSTFLAKKLDTEIFNKLKPNQSLIVLWLDETSMYTPDLMSMIVGDERLYKNTPLLYLVFSLVRNQVFIDAENKLETVSFSKKGAWTVVKFTKLNNHQ